MTAVRFPIASMLALATAASALAGEMPSTSDAVSCTKLRNDNERLACYDRALDYDAGSPSITARVKALGKSAQGALIIELDNGQRWVQTQATDLLLSADDEVTITRAAMSSFRINTPAQRSAKVRRLQ